MRLVVVCCFLDEAVHLPAFLASMGAQTRPPDRLVLVDDGSVDGSQEIAETWAATVPWAEVLRRPRRPREHDRLATAAELKAFHWAVGRLGDDPWDVIVKMDGDLELRPDHLAAVLEALDADPRLGLAGAYLARRDGDRLVREPHPEEHVRGPNKFFRRACWNDVAPLPEHLGWDSIDEVRARMHGWRTRSIELPGGDSVHLRPTGAHDGRLRAFRRWGLCAWGAGADALSATASAALLARRPPYVIGGASYLFGWARAAVVRAPRADAATAAAFNRERHARIRRALRAGPRP